MKLQNARKKNKILNLLRDIINKNIYFQFLSFLRQNFLKCIYIYYCKILEKIYCLFSSIN